MPQNYPLFIPKESDILKQARKLLKVCGVWHFRHHSTLGSAPGVPDLLGIHESHVTCPHCHHEIIVPGRFIAMEAKRPGPDHTQLKRKEQQDEFRNVVNEHGGLAFRFTSMEELVKQLGLTQVHLGPVFGRR